jgi:hypothetical protein
MTSSCRVGRAGLGGFAHQARQSLDAFRRKEEFRREFSSLGRACTAWFALSQNRDERTAFSRD